MRRVSILLLVAMLAGCSGRYILTAPEQVGCVGGQTVMVARLQYEEVTSVHPPVGNACIRFRVETCPVRGAYTDKPGYAAAVVPLPDKAGRYYSVIEHTDKDGREVSRFVPVYVWDKDTPVVAVDLDAISSPGGTKASAALKALQKMHETANIIYLTQKSLEEHANLHGQLKGGGFPDGPILMWQREYWRLVQEGMLTKVMVEDRLVSQLPELKRMFPNLVAGITDSPLAAQSFLMVDVKAVYVGQEGLFLPKVHPDVRRSSWQEIADKGIPSVAGAVRPANPQTNESKQD